MKLTKEEKEEMLQWAHSDSLKKGAQEMDEAIAKLPKLTPLQYIRWLDEYQRAFGQFPISHEPPTYYSMPKQ